MSLIFQSLQIMFRQDNTRGAIYKAPAVEGMTLKATSLGASHPVDDLDLLYGDCSQCSVVRIFHWSYTCQEGGTRTHEITVMHIPEAPCTP